MLKPLQTSLPAAPHVYLSAEQSCRLKISPRWFILQQVRWREREQCYIVGVVLNTNQDSDRESKHLWKLSALSSPLNGL